MSNAPNTRKRKKPAFDLDAIEVEATGEPFRFTLGGTEYTIPTLVDFRVTAFLSENDWANAIRVLVGPEQWQKILDGTEPLTLERCIAIIEQWTTHIGISAGKSRASTRSS